MTQSLNNMATFYSKTMSNNNTPDWDSHPSTSSIYPLQHHPSSSQ